MFSLPEGGTNAIRYRGFVCFDGGSVSEAPAIIDMHLHAYPADAQGPPPVAVCTPYEQMPVRDARWDAQTYAAKTFKQAICAHPVW